MYVKLLGKSCLIAKTSSCNPQSEHVYVIHKAQTLYCNTCTVRPLHKDLQNRWRKGYFWDGREVVNEFGNLLQPKRKHRLQNNQSSTEVALEESVFTNGFNCTVDRKNRGMVVRTIHEQHFSFSGVRICGCCSLGPAVWLEILQHIVRYGATRGWGLKKS